MSNIEKLPKEWVKIVSALYEKGASDTEVRTELRMTKALWDSLYNDPVSSSFKEVVDFGRELAKGWWLKQGRVSLKDRAFNANLWHMNMKNRFGWSDKTTADVKQATDMSQEELEEAAKAAVAKLRKLRIVD